GGGNTSFKCNYCQNLYKGSYSRVRAHLLKISGVGIRASPKVAHDHLVEMQKLVEKAKSMNLPKQVPLPPTRDHASSFGSNIDSGVFRQESFEPRKWKASSKFPGSMEKAFNVQARENVKSEIARMFYSGGLSFNLARCQDVYLRSLSLKACF
ncbi:hypothetical protein CFOL_v3_18408, partial [Cephalotus follicularis]